MKEGLAVKEYIVKGEFPDLIHSPHTIYVCYVLYAHSPDNAASRACKLAYPSIKQMLRKLNVSPYEANYAASEMFVITSIEEIT